MIRSSVQPYFFTQSSAHQLVRTQGGCGSVVHLPTVRCKSSAPSSYVMDLFSQLRWKAAHMLTSGMNADEKALLMSKLDIPAAVHSPETSKDSNATTLSSSSSSSSSLSSPLSSSTSNLSIEVQKTIGEAVAAARMAEAQRQQSKWDTEREFLLRNAEEAARARVENELLVQERRLAVMRWKKDLEEELSRNAQQENATTATEAVENEDTSSEMETMPHPVLGPVVADLGYKKIYQVSAQTLASIPVWKKQRSYRHDRAKVIAADKLKTLHLGLPGILVLHEDTNGKLTILDGQHRIGALALLAEKSPNNFDLERILVEVFTSNDEEKNLAEEIFVEINKSEPIKLVDMPGVAKTTDRNLITQAAAKLQEQYPDMFRPSQQCRPPHLNVDNLRDAIFAAEIITRHDLKSPGALVKWLDAQNQALQVKYEDPVVAAKINAKVLQKARDFKFFLGLESSWLYN